MNPVPANDRMKHQPSSSRQVISQGKTELQRNPAAHSLRSAADYCGIESNQCAKLIAKYHIPYEKHNGRYYIDPVVVEAFREILVAQGHIKG
jgi:hypothetical protein